jgi:hypothetical protein|tara:strand:+ start:96 stop:425 length:330 start_codon:yes stop_codon:yes gene_type:complete
LIGALLLLKFHWSGGFFNQLGIHRKLPFTWYTWTRHFRQHDCIAMRYSLLRHGFRKVICPLLRYVSFSNSGLQQKTGVFTPLTSGGKVFAVPRRTLRSKVRRAPPGAVA